MSAARFFFFHLTLLVIVSSTDLQAQDVLSPNPPGSSSCPSGYKYSMNWCYKTAWTKAVEEAQEENRARKQQELVNDEDPSPGLDYSEQEEVKEIFEDFATDIENMVEEAKANSEQGKIRAKPLLEFLELRIAERKAAPPDTCMEDFVNTNSGYIDAVGAHSEKAGLLPGDLVIEQDGIPWPTEKYTDVEWGEVTTFRVLRNGEKLEFSFKCPFSYADTIRDEGRLAEAIRAGQWNECRRLAREFDKYTGRSQLYEQFNVLCWSVAGGDGFSEAFLDSLLLKIRYYSYELEDLTSYRPHLVYYIQEFEKAGLISYAKELERSYQSAYQKLSGE